MEIPFIIQRELRALTDEEIRERCGEISAAQLAAVKAFIGSLAPEMVVYRTDDRLPTRAESRDRLKAIADECMEGVRYYDEMARVEQSGRRAASQQTVQEHLAAHQRKQKARDERVRRLIADGASVRLIATDQGCSTSRIRDRYGRLLDERRANATDAHHAEP